MSRNPAALLALILALGGCVEGGSRGSGISTAVFGNVVAVQMTAPQSDVAGISVAIEGTGLRDETDANGDFSVAGNFEGVISLVFALPNGGGQARIALNVPAGGTLTLNNVVIDTEAEEAVAETQGVEFDAVVTSVDCAASILTLASSQESSGDVDQYTLRLDTSSVQDSNGTPVPCADLRSGDRASVDGLVNPDGTFGHAAVVLQD